MKAIAHTFAIIFHFLFTSNRTNTNFGYHSAGNHLSRPIDNKSIPNSRKLYRYESRFDDLSNLHNATQLEDVISTFIHIIRSFVSDSAFNIIGFDSQVGNLSKMLERIDDLVINPDREKTNFEKEDGVQNNFESQNTQSKQDILLRHKVAVHMFQTLRQTVELLYIFKKRHSTTSDLVCKVVHLNARLLALLDDRGSPNRKIFHLDFKLTRLQWILGMWKRRFVALKHGRKDEKTIFNSQYSQAQRVLRFLAETLKDPEGETYPSFLLDWEIEHGILSVDLAHY